MSHKVFLNRNKTFLVNLCAPNFIYIKWLYLYKVGFTMVLISMHEQYHVMYFFYFFLQLMLTL